jgi:hypothetical protein
MPPCVRVRCPVFAFLASVYSSAIEALDQKVPFGAEVVFRTLVILPVAFLGLTAYERVRPQENDRCQVMEQAAVPDSAQLRAVLCPSRQLP